MNRNITLIRHPKPIDYNNICYGQTNLDVSDKDVHTLVQNIKNKVLKRKRPSPIIFSSPLKRCQKVAEKLNQPYQISPLIKELSMGIYDGQPWNSIPQKYFQNWEKDPIHFQFPKGESFLDLKKRVSQFFTQTIITKSNRDLILICHKGPILCTLNILEKMSIKELLKKKINYAEILTLSWSK